MSVQTSATQELLPGEKVKLVSAIEGSFEKDIVYGDPNDSSNREKSTQPKDTEVVIRKTRPRSLPRTSTGGPGESGLDKDYSCQKVLNTKYRLVKDTAILVTQHRVPHTYLSSTEGGTPDTAQTFTDKQYAHVIKEFSYNTKDGKKTIGVNEIIKIQGGPRTSTGKELSPTTAYPLSATYAFYKTESKERKWVFWKSDEFYPATAFKKV